MLSWGSLLIATVPDTKDIMDDLSGGDAVSRTGPLYPLAQPCFFLLFILLPLSREMNLALGFFSNSMLYCTRALIIQGEPRPLKPFLQVPPRACFLNETVVCCRLLQPPLFPLRAAESLPPYQRSCYLFHLVFYYLLTL